MIMHNKTAYGYYWYTLFENGARPEDVISVDILKRHLAVADENRSITLKDVLEWAGSREFEQNNWWAVATYQTENHVEITLFRNHLAIFTYSRHGQQGVPAAFKQTTAAQIISRKTLYETTETIESAFSFTDYPIQVFDEIYRNEPTDSHAVARKFVKIVLMWPIVAPFMWIRWAINVVRQTKLIDSFLSTLQSNDTSATYYVVYFFYLVTILIFVNQRFSATSVASGIVSTALATYGVLKQSDITRDVILAVSIELVIELTGLSTKSQVIATALVALFFVILNILRNDVNGVWIFVWIWARILRTVRYGATEELRWSLSQLLLAFVISINMIRSFAKKRSTSSSLTNFLIFNVSKKTEAVLNVAILLFIHSQYLKKDVIPWKVQFIYLIIPICYVISCTVQVTRPTTSTIVATNSATKMVKFMAGLISLACIVRAYTSKRIAKPLTAKPFDDICDVAVTNLRPCSDSNTKEQFVYGQCCKNYTDIQIETLQASVFRTASGIPCKNKVTTFGEDCCGKEFIDKTAGSNFAYYLSGKYGCLCNQVPSGLEDVPQNGNTFDVTTNQCVCDINHFGELCQYSAMQQP